LKTELVSDFLGWRNLTPVLGIISDSSTQIGINSEKTNTKLFGKRNLIPVQFSTEHCMVIESTCIIM
jgi:hypothetical protein